MIEASSNRATRTPSAVPGHLHTRTAAYGRRGPSVIAEAIFGSSASRSGGAKPDRQWFRSAGTSEGVAGRRRGRAALSAVGGGW